MLLQCISLLLHGCVVFCVDYSRTNEGLSEVPTGIPSNTNRIYLGQNSITAFDPSRISHLDFLTDIDIQNNDLTEFPNFCNVAASLLVVKVNRNPIVSLDQTRLDCLTLLTTLEMAETDLTNIDSLSFALISDTIKSIVIGFADYVSIPRFPDLPALETFNVRRSQNLLLPTDYFIGLNWPWLTYLNIDDIANTQMPDLSEIAWTLERFYISDTRFTDLPHRSFAQMRYVTTLHLRGTSFTFFPTTCPADPSAMHLEFQGSAIELCECRHVWVKMVKEMGAWVQHDNPTCAVTSWIEASTQDLIDSCQTTPGEGSTIHILCRALGLQGSRS